MLRKGSIQRNLAAPSAVLFLAVSCAVPAQADWLRFRGPNGNGAVEDVTGPVAFDSERSITWKAELPGRGLSSPIIIGDRVVVTCSSGVRQEKLHVICFDAKDGSLRWERNFWSTGRTMTHNKTCVAAPSPVSDGERIFALYSCNDLICLDLEGNLRWLRGLTLDYPNASNSLGMASSPVVAGDTLVVQIENDSESFAAGIDRATGKNRWKTDRARKANWTSPVVLKDSATGGDVVALQGSAGVSAVDPDTGREVWAYEDGAATMASGAASGDGSVLFVPSHGLTALQAGPERNVARQLWREEQQSPGTASPLVLGDHVFTLNNAGVLTCAETKTGERLWRLRLKGPFSASPVAAGKRLYFFSEKGVGQIVDVSGAEGTVSGEIELGETILATPSISDGAIYVRSDGHLWKIGG